MFSEIKAAEHWIQVLEAIEEKAKGINVQELLAKFLAVKAKVMTWLAEGEALLPEVKAICSELGQDLDTIIKEVAPPSVKK